MCKIAYVDYYEARTSLPLLSRVIVDDKNRETEVSCVDNFGKSAGMGLLDGGMMVQVPVRQFRCSLVLDRMLPTRIDAHDNLIFLFGRFP